MAQVQTVPATAGNSTGRRHSSTGRSLALSTKGKESGALGLRGKAVSKHFVDVKSPGMGKGKQAMDT